MEGGREDGGDFFGVEARDHLFFYVEIGGFRGGGGGVRGTKEGNAWSDAEFGLCEVRGQFTEVFDAEAGREFGVGGWEADFFAGFAARGVEGGFG